MSLRELMLAGRLLGGLTFLQKVYGMRQEREEGEMIGEIRSRHDWWTQRGLGHNGRSSQVKAPRPCGAGKKAGVGSSECGAEK
jgi:hypothetical protein